MSKLLFIIEDDDFIRADFEELLSIEGYETKSYRNGREALDALLSPGLRPRLILLDLMMPVMNGYEFLIEINKSSELAKIPVLVLSADGQADSKLPREKVRGFMRKPIDLEPFLNLVEKLAV